jgi:large subunit ribosomal protein L43
VWYAVGGAAMAKRGVWALRQLTLHYCKNGGSSRGVREYIETGLVDFARQNPQIECRTVVRNGRHPYVQGLYPANLQAYEEAAANGTYEQTERDRTLETTVKNMLPEEVEQEMLALRARTGRKALSNSKLKKGWFSRHPSIQGMWAPGMFSSS